jgi:hypothetical protein
MEASALTSFDIPGVVINTGMLGFIGWLAHHLISKSIPAMQEKFGELAAQQRADQKAILELQHQSLLGVIREQATIFERQLAQEREERMDTGERIIRSINELKACHESEIRQH